MNKSISFKHDLKRDIFRHITSDENNPHHEGSGKVIDENVIFSHTDLNGTIIDASQRLCDISGYTKDELIGQPHNILRHPDMPKSVFEDMWQTISSGEKWSGDIKNLKKDGSFYWVYTTVVPIKNERGNIISYASVRQDITDKIAFKELNQNLEEKIAQKVFEVTQLNNQLMESSKLAQMGEMMEDITHQWKQPLSVISSIATHILLSVELDKVSSTCLVQHAEGIMTQTQYLSNVVQTFQNFLGVHRPLSPVILQNRLNDILTITSHTLKNNHIDLIKEFDEERISLTLPKGELAQVIVNIINNAKDAVVEKNAAHNRWIKIKLTKFNGNALICIEDNGGGIPDDALPKVFDSHFTTKEDSKGTGIGLYMSQRIICERLNGQLSVKNGEDGAMFFIKLPLDNQV